MGVTMIAPLAITLALAFWAPYNGGQPVCPNGVNIHYIGFGQTPGPNFVARDTATGDLIPQCEMFAEPHISRYSIEDQCTWIARNIGASFFGLAPSMDSRNVMYANGWVVPGACHPVRSRRQGLRPFSP